MPERICIIGHTLDRLHHRFDSWDRARHPELSAIATHSQGERSSRSNIILFFSSLLLPSLLSAHSLTASSLSPLFPLFLSSSVCCSPLSSSFLPSFLSSVFCARAHEALLPPRHRLFHSPSPPLPPHAAPHAVTLPVCPHLIHVHPCSALACPALMFPSLRSPPPLSKPLVSFCFVLPLPPPPAPPALASSHSSLLSFARSPPSLRPPLHAHLPARARLVFAWMTTLDLDASYTIVCSQQQHLSNLKPLISIQREECMHEAEARAAPRTVIAIGPVSKRLVLALSTSGRRDRDKATRVLGTQIAPSVRDLILLLCAVLLLTSTSFQSSFRIRAAIVPAGTARGMQLWWDRNSVRIGTRTG